MPKRREFVEVPENCVQPRLLAPDALQRRWPLPSQAGASESRSHFSVGEYGRPADGIT